MLLQKFVERYQRKLKQTSPRDLLRELSRELRSDDVPAVLRDAARSVASLLDGADGAAGNSGSASGVTINVTIAVAVGAPGKEQQGSSQQAPPNDAVVIASAVAAIPRLPSPGAPQPSVDEESRKGDGPDQSGSN